MSKHKSDGGENALVIKGPDFSIEINGDPGFIHESYHALRKGVMSRFVKVLTQPQKPEVMSSLDVPARGGEQSFREVAPSATYVWVCVCHNYYNKIHVLNRTEFAKTSLASFLDSDALFRVYLERKHRDALESIVGKGRMLWSELTQEGQEHLGAEP